MTTRKIFICPDIDNYINIIADLEPLGYLCFSDQSVLNNLESKKTELMLLKLNKNNLEYIVGNKADLSIPTLFIGSREELYPEELELLNRVNYLNILDSSTSSEELINNIELLIEKHNTLVKAENSDIWFSSVLNATSESIIAIDSTSRIKYMNPVAQQLIGIEYFNSIGREATKIIKFKDPSISKALEVREVITKDNNNFEGEILNRITKVYNSVSGSITSVRDNNGIVVGKILTLKDIGEIKSLFNRVKHQSSHDSLTGLMNRQSFIDCVDELIALSNFDGSQHGLLVVALDKFKVINDTSGHNAGDELLRKISYILRDIDPENNFVKGRIGGDEFGILFKNRTLQEIKHFTKSIKRKISKHDFIWGEKEFPILSSYGIVIIDSRIKNHHTLFAAADDACEIAKENGGNKIEIYNDVKDEYNKRRGEILWINKLKKVVNSKQLLLYYQIIESAKDEDFKKIEILVRLKDDQGIIISPNDFIPPAERYGVMPEIDRIVIEKSIEACKKIIDNKSNIKNYIFSVNISGTSIPDKSLPTFIFSLFRKYKVPPTLFCFEITETSAIKNLNIAKEFIDNLKRIGCRFSLDDFGSGYSNFAYLRNLKVDYLKIDGSIVKDIIDEPINRAMVDSINSIGHIMKIKTIAEFVETEEIKNELISIGVDYLQGYAICKPTPIEMLFR